MQIEMDSISQNLYPCEVFPGTKRRKGLWNENSEGQLRKYAWHTFPIVFPDNYILRNLKLNLKYMWHMCGPYRCCEWLYLKAKVAC